MRTAAQLRAAAVRTGTYTPYVGDGASVPWETVILVSLPAGLTLRAFKAYLDAAAPEAFKLHDWLYTLYGRFILASREEADMALFEELAVADPIAARIVYAAVRLGGAPYWGISTTGVPVQGLTPNTRTPGVRTLIGDP